ncbi:MAG: M3 family metallopeptidase [Burkholderiales bacterium]
MLQEANPLLDFTDLPRFGDLRAEHVTPAIDQLLAEARDVVAQVTRPDTADAWDAFVVPLEDASERLGRAWNQVSHLHAVMDAPALRAAYNENLPRVTQFWTELGQNEHLFRKYRALRDGPAFSALSAARQRIVDNALRDFHLGGADLPAAQKPRYAKIHEELAALAAKFSENVLDATNAFSVRIEDPARVKGLPADALAAAREAAEKDGAPGWKFTLHAPSYFPVMQYAEDRALREEMYRASATRASEFGRPEWDNTALIARILELRREEAALLGYANFAERSLVPKMADTPAQVLEFLEDLARRARPYAERDHAQLVEFARDELGLEQLEAWDVAFASERLRERRYAFSNNEVKQYLPEDAVLGGLFGLVEKLYAVRIVPAEAPVWHEDVRFYEVRSTSGELTGRFYLDLYARETKRGGAWMDEAVSRRRRGGSVQTPLVYLNCNFSRPVAGRPAVFDHDEVMTLFHETGHGLHSLLTRQDELGVSGLAGVEWDAVELPSQFMENFCWEWEVLEPMTRHVDTGERMPKRLFDKMLAAKNFQAGLAMLRQLEFSIFDMRLHHDFDPAAGKRVLELLAEVRKKVAVMVPPDYNRFPNSFSHIFGGGYAAGYYSYKWAEVLSADAYSAFEEQRDKGGILDAATGARFRDEVLAVGGSRPAAESFRAFRGRDPSVDALLRHSGMISA